jgi:DNA helicase-2/ATP-dependent DNA helicase PcrA
MTLIDEQRGVMLKQPGKLSVKIRALIDKVDYPSHIIVECGKNEKAAKAKFWRINSLIESVERWEADPDVDDKGLFAYLNRVSLITNTDGDDANAGKVSLMTIHAAKGLEFPVVFIAGCEDGIIPHQRAVDEADKPEAALEEERRLFYVAITRARQTLYITYCQKRKKAGGAEADVTPSPFLDEIPQELLLEDEVDDQKPAAAEEEDPFAAMNKKFGIT